MKRVIAAALLMLAAVESAATWPDNLGLTLSLSPAQQRVPGLADILRHALEQAGLAPHRLVLEMEGAPAETITALRSLGIGVRAAQPAP